MISKRHFYFIVTGFRIKQSTNLLIFLKPKVRSRLDNPTFWILSPHFDRRIRYILKIMLVPFPKLYSIPLWISDSLLNVKIKGIFILIITMIISRHLSRVKLKIVDFITGRLYTTKVIWYFLYANFSFPHSTTIINNCYLPCFYSSY